MDSTYPITVRLRESDTTASFSTTTYESKREYNRILASPKLKCRRLCSKNTISPLRHAVHIRTMIQGTFHRKVPYYHPRAFDNQDHGLKSFVGTKCGRLHLCCSVCDCAKGDYNVSSTSVTRLVN